MKITSPMRGRKASQVADLTDLRSLMKDTRLWCVKAVVKAYEGEDSHWERDSESGHILVQVETVPNAYPLVCRLGCAAGGFGMGLWRVPAPGVEVIVDISGGELEDEAAIVAILDSGSPPDRVSDSRTILVATDSVEVLCDDVKLGGFAGVEHTILGDTFQPLLNAVLTALQGLGVALSAEIGTAGSVVGATTPQKNALDAAVATLATATTALSTAPVLTTAVKVK